MANMITKTVYEIKFLNPQGHTLKVLTFDFESQRDDLYNQIDSIDHREVPAGCTRVEQWSRIVSAPAQLRRSIVSGRFKGGAN